jgi:hypothetical protein
LFEEPSNAGGAEKTRQALALIAVTATAGSTRMAGQTGQARDFPNHGMRHASRGIAY